MKALATRARHLAPLMNVANRKTQAAIATTVLGMTASAALAFTAPAQGDLGFEMYDLVVNDIMQGAIGVALAMGAIAFGAFNALQGRFVSFVLSLVVGVAMITSDEIVTAVGFVV